MENPHGLRLSTTPPLKSSADDITSGSPIAFITNGDETLTPFIFIIEPAHFIELLDDILCPFISTASAPAELSSFTKKLFN